MTEQDRFVQPLEKRLLRSAQGVGEAPNPCPCRTPQVPVCRFDACEGSTPTPIEEFPTRTVDAIQPAALSAPVPRRIRNKCDPMPTD